MKTQILEDLQNAIQPYLFYWEEWIANGNCNLSIAEIELVNIHLRNNFSAGFLDLFDFYDKAQSIRDVIRKLDIGYQVFKDFVVVEFLTSLVEMAKAYGYDKFLQTPIKDLEIHEDLRSLMLAFGARTLNLLFIINKAEDFSRGWLYKNIVHFQTSIKQQRILLLR